MSRRSERLAAGAPTGRDQRTGLLLRLAHQRVRRAFNQALGELRIETRHLGVLASLDRDEPLNQKHLVKHLELDKSSVVLIVDDLERLGLAVRGPDPRDRRAHALRITDRGRGSLRAAERIAERLGRVIFAGLGSRQRQVLDAALRRIADNCHGLQEPRDA